MACKVPDAKRWRKNIPAFSDAELQKWIGYTDINRLGGKRRSPEWCLCRGLVQREARKRGISL